MFFYASALYIYIIWEGEGETGETLDLIPRERAGGIERGGENILHNTKLTCRYYLIDSIYLKTQIRAIARDYTYLCMQPS